MLYNIRGRLSIIVIIQSVKRAGTWNDRKDEWG